MIWILLIALSLSFTNSLNAQDIILDNTSTKTLDLQFDHSGAWSRTASSSINNLSDDLEKYLTSIQLATFLYLEYGIDHHTTNNKTSTPNKLDRFFRDKIRWGVEAKDDAESASDILLYGDIFLTMTILPFFSDNGYLDMLKTSLECHLFEWNHH